MTFLIHNLMANSRFSDSYNIARIPRPWVMEYFVDVTVGTELHNSAF